MDIMTTNDILAMARKCAIQRDCNRYGLLKADFYSAEFKRTCEFYAMRKRVNDDLISRFDIGRVKFGMRLIQRTTVIPTIRFWS